MHVFTIDGNSFESIPKRKRASPNLIEKLSACVEQHSTNLRIDRALHVSYSQVQNFCVHWKQDTVSLSGTCESLTQNGTEYEMKFFDLSAKGCLFSCTCEDQEANKQVMCKHVVLLVRNFIALHGENDGNRKRKREEDEDDDDKNLPFAKRAKLSYLLQSDKDVMHAENWTSLTPKQEDFLKLVTESPMQNVLLDFPTSGGLFTSI